MWSTHFLILLDIPVCYPKHCAVITGFVNKLDCLWETVKATLSHLNSDRCPIS